MVPCVHELFCGQVCGLLCQFAAFFLPALKRVRRFVKRDWSVFASAVNQASEAKVHQIALVHHHTTLQRVLGAYAQRMKFTALSALPAADTMKCLSFFSAVSQF